MTLTMTQDIGLSTGSEVGKKQVARMKKKSKKITVLLLVFFSLSLSNCIFKNEEPTPALPLRPKVESKNKAKFEVISIERGIIKRMYGQSPLASVTVTVENTGNTTGYNVKVVIYAVNSSGTIIDTASAFPAHLENIRPKQTAKDEAIFFNVSYNVVCNSELDYDIYWLTRN